MTKDEALKKMQAVKTYMTSGNPIWDVTEIGEAFGMAIEALEQPEQKIGKWERHYSRPGVYADLYWYCSACGFASSYEWTKMYKICPECGARMEWNGEE